MVISFIPLDHTAEAVGKQINNCFGSCFSTTTPGAKSSRGINWCKAKVTSNLTATPSTLPVNASPAHLYHLILMMIMHDNDKTGTVDYGMDNHSPQRNLITNNEPSKF